MLFVHEASPKFDLTKHFFSLLFWNYCSAHFIPMFHFNTPMKRQKTKRFLMASWAIEVGKEFFYFGFSSKSIVTYVVLWVIVFSVINSVVLQ